jgi:hypothetical protein
MQNPNLFMISLVNGMDKHLVFKDEVFFQEEFSFHVKANIPNL